MKNESPRSQALPTRHQFDHAVPTVIHHPEEDMTVLGRWAHKALEDPTRFWGWVIGVVVGVIALVMLANLLSSSGSRGSDVWAKLETAKSPAERVDIAKESPNSPAATWALLEAATEYFNQGFADLPNNKDVALPTLKKALDLFDQVAKDAPKDSPQARAAALGKARTLEARNELPKAIEQYQLVQKSWPQSAEAAHAKQFEAVLQQPDAAAFYKELYAYQPTKVTLPPMGSENLNLPLLPSPPGATIPGLGKGAGEKSSIIPDIPLLPPPPPTPVTKPEPAPAKAQETPKADAGKPAAASPEAKTPRAELPGDVFSGKADEKKDAPKP